MISVSSSIMCLYKTTVPTYGNSDRKVIIEILENSLQNWSNLFYNLNTALIINMIAIVSRAKR